MWCWILNCCVLRDWQLPTEFYFQYILDLFFGFVNKCHQIIPLSQFERFNYKTILFFFFLPVHFPNFVMLTYLLPNGQQSIWWHLESRNSHKFRLLKVHPILKSKLISNSQNLSTLTYTICLFHLSLQFLMKGRGCDVFCSAFFLLEMNVWYLNWSWVNFTLYSCKVNPSGTRMEAWKQVKKNGCFIKKFSWLLITLLFSLLFLKHCALGWRQKWFSWRRQIICRISRFISNPSGILWVLTQAVYFCVVSLCTC